MRVLKKELWPAKIMIPKDEFDGDHYHIERWLDEKLGVIKDRWNFVPCSNGVHYYFRNEKDATLFALKWS